MEIDPNRQSGPWTLYPVGPLEELNSPFASSGSPSKTGQTPVDYGTAPALEAWYAANDGPWPFRGAVPEATQIGRSQLRDQQNRFRTNGYGPQLGRHHRPGDPSETGSVHYGIPPPSDSGYGTRRSLENASVRSCEITNPTLDNRGFPERNLEIPFYGDNGPLRDPSDANVWVRMSGGLELSDASSGMRCPTCNKIVKTKSEMKYENQDPLQRIY